MKILKASAGSGKTFRLANKYVDILLNSRDPYEYRHILAVTFTNKATAEMKTKILKELSKRAATDGRAKKILTSILHDYGAFSVCTIDKFFQQALRAFSREIGQFQSYQIELDRQSLISESMDRVLDSLTEDSRDLLEWIKGFLEESVENGEKFHIEKRLREIGVQLKSEEHRNLADRYGIDDRTAYNKEKLSEMRKLCRGITDEFEKKVLEMGAVRGNDGKIKKPGKKLFAANPELEEYWDDNFRTYNTARKIDGLVFSLGLAGEFYREFDILTMEKNVMCLDESNTLLQKIIGGSDAPFVYEKLGVRFRNFLLDEFQDTSTVQWENFLPLLKESESGGGDNLIVGDIKQSIYRFRNSDWKLLAEKVGEAFPENDTEVLGCNWRSCGKIVDFNNRFFEYAAEMTGLGKLYADVRQKPMTGDGAQPGQVRVSFTDDIRGKVLESVMGAKEQGAVWSDIAVLVRGNKEGSELAAFLIGNGIPVISDDSLKLKSSITVRRLVSLLTFIDNPEDSVGSFLSGTLNVDYPRTYHSLVDLSEGIIRSLKAFSPQTFAGETLFIQAFMDDLQNWVATGGNNLRGFLKHWSEVDPSISSPSGVDSVRVITIHKSKGLEYPYVIFPHAEKVEFYKHGVKWCRADSSGIPFRGAIDGIYPVDLTEDCADSIFSEAYFEERKLQLIDNINIFYVALTRAVKTLHIISSPPTATFRKTADSPQPDFKRFSDILYVFCGKSEEYSEGKPYDFSRMLREDGNQGAKAGYLNFTYDSIPLGKRLTPSADASDFFGDDGSIGGKASARLGGIILHDILSGVIKASDLKTSVDRAVLEGSISPEEGREVFRLLQERISEHPEWFPEDGSVRTEAIIFSENGLERRPDRVVSTADGSTLIVDYKFGGQNPDYENQLRSYMDIYRSMGRDRISGYIWYVRTGEVVEVGQ